MAKNKSLKEIFFILENFHPIPLFVSSGLMYLIIQKMLIDLPFFQKINFIIIAGIISAIAFTHSLNNYLTVGQLYSIGVLGLMYTGLFAIMSITYFGFSIFFYHISKECVHDAKLEGE